MRRLSTSRLLRTPNVPTNSTPGAPHAALSKFFISRTIEPPSRSLASVRDFEPDLQELWFSGSTSRRCSDGKITDGKGLTDERTVKLGKTVRILHERLPTLLAQPLPQEILSPQITLHLFPSTHPHLPKVSGRIAYIAALWTAPVAWGRVPVVGNVKLVILSERMVKNGAVSGQGQGHEKLIVRWKTCGKTNSSNIGSMHQAGTSSGQVDTIKEVLGGDGQDDKEFCGLFIFEFDKDGRISSHIIEHVEQGRNFDKMTRVVSVTDWLLGKAKGRHSEEVPGLALCEPEERRDALRRHHERRRRDSF
ncbi:MAG: hypothetical protein M1822_005936 [Bathelium mastoideum]|nr:MAG: hypothetical protein M1822_005936 [Bathelium mastoideum]